MKRTILKAVLALSMIGMLSFTACGSAQTNDNVESETTESVENTDEAAESEEVNNEEKNEEVKEEVSSDAQNSEASSEEGIADSSSEYLSGLHHVEIVIKNYGTIALELDADTAPISTTNFINLAKDGFYDGLTFHRIISGFMIQGGDPLGNGTGGSDQTIKGEFAANGIENNISHTRGVISMARSQIMDSASSQFFIMHEDGPFLDGQYAAFGHVTSGIEFVDAICADTQVEDQNGTVLPENQPVIEKITVID